MSLQRQLGIAVALLFLPFTSFGEEEALLYETVDSWRVMVDPTLNNGCFILATYEEDSVFRYGKDNRDGWMYALFGNSNWKSIEVGKKYDLELKLGTQTPWEVRANGVSFDEKSGHPYLWVNISPGETSELFLSELMTEHFIEVFYQNTSIDKLSLRGSRNAILKMQECQQIMDRINQEKDPFHNEKSKTSDPFAV
jgi:hypothetical protein